MSNIDGLKSRVAQAATTTPDTPADTPANLPAVTDEGVLEPTAVTIPDRAAQDGVFRWLKEYRGYWRQLLPANVSPDAFELAALAAVQNDEYLTNVAQHNARSLVYAMSMCAHFGLIPDGVQAALVAYGGSATFIPMYRGYVTLLRRYKVIKDIRFNFVREGDTVELDNGKPAPDDFSHKVNLLAPIPEGKSDRDPLIAYCYAWLPDGTRSEVVTMPRERAIFIRDEYSTAYQNAEKNRKERAKEYAENPRKKRFNSPWHTPDGDNVAEPMWLKSVVRLWVKRMDLTAPILGELVAADAADSTTGQKVAIPAKVMRALATPPDVVVSEPHPYHHDERTDPYCGLDGCTAFWDDAIHQVD